MLRFFATLNGEKVVGLVRFDRETVTTSRYDKVTQEWVDDLEDMDIVLGIDNNNREVDEAEAHRILGTVLAPAAD